MNEESNPAISVVKGNPTPEELAAVVVVLTSSAGHGARPEPEPEPVSEWAAYWRSLRAPIAPGPGAWRQSARPQ